MKARIYSAGKFLIPAFYIALVTPFSEPSPPSPVPRTVIRPGPAPIGGIPHHEAQMPIGDLDISRPFKQTVPFDRQWSPIGRAGKNNVMRPKFNAPLIYNWKRGIIRIHGRAGD